MKLLVAISISAQQVNAPNVSISGLPGIVINAMLYIAGGLSVIFVIVGGLKYVLSTGDPGRINAARQTILWALIGLAISAVAFVIVHYVVTSI